MSESSPDGAGIRYAYKASLVGAALRFELTDAGLAWHIGGRTGLWPYQGISSIRLSFRPVSMQSRRFRAEIRNAAGARIVVLSTSWQTAALMEPQGRDYSAFITELHRRMTAAGSQATLRGGLGPSIYIAAVVLLALVAVAISGLLVRAIATGELAGALFLVGFAALLAWQVGGFVRRNRPRAYTFAELPRELLP